MKKIILSFLFSASIFIVAAQPRCFVVGPAMNVGSTTIDNYSFSRLNTVTTEGAPVNTFSDFGTAKNKATSVGLLMDVYTKRWRFGMDIMYPLKGSQANFFNLNLACGGYIKEKVGILVGISGYASSKMYSATPADTGSVLLATNADYKTSGKFYSNAAPGSNIGANLLLTYALKENIVFRLDIGKYIATTESKKTPYLDNYEFKRKGSTKIEVGGVWMISDKFGLFAKFNMWNIKGYIIAKDVEYDMIANGTTTKATTEIQLTPEQTFKSKNFTFGIMIPLGGAESQSGTITVSPK